jgi:hypothetical protein
MEMNGGKLSLLVNWGKLIMNDLNILNNLLSIVNNHQLCISETDVLNFLKNRKRWPVSYPWGQSSIEIITQFSGSSQMNIFDSDGYFNYDQWSKYYELGFTSIISGVLDLDESLRSLQDKIMEYTGSKINGNFYLSRGTSKHRVSFDDHDHNYYVIVKPIYGKSKWRLSGKEFEAKQEAFLIRYGETHSVYECTDKKLSLTLNII